VFSLYTLYHYIDLDYKKISEGYFNNLNLSKSPSVNDKGVKLNGSMYNSVTVSSTVPFKSSPSTHFIKPKLITVINHGPKPREVIKLLLNKKTVHSFDQVLTNIQEKFKTNFGPLRKIYSLSCKPILLLQDFFNDEDIFITFTCDKTAKQDFDLHPEEHKNIYTKMSNRDSAKGAYSPSKRLFCSNTSLRSSLASKVDYSSSISSSVSSSSANVDNTDTSSKKVTKTLKNCIISEEEEKDTKASSPCLDKEMKKVTPARSKSSRQSRIPSLQILKDCKKNFDSRALNDPNTSKHHLLGTNSNSLSILFPREVNKKYEIGQIIGNGNFAVVHECINKSNGRYYALKIINKSKCKGKEAMIANEVEILRKITHPYIIDLIEEFDLANKLYLVMEYVAGGDLFETIRANDK